MIKEKIEDKKSSDNSSYVSAALEDFCLNGDAYVTEELLYKICKNEKNDLPYHVFSKDYREQLLKNDLHREGQRIYVDRIWRCEENAAQDLARRLRLLPLPQAVLPETLKVGETILTPEQRDTVCMALSNRLSMVLGGAGCGKSTLIRAIVDQSGSNCYIVCAPTGKAARNITDRTGLPARTVHSACGISPEEDFEPPVRWSMVDLVVVDEASMLTTELLAHLLYRAKDGCRIILLGDPDQLPSVGAGNVINDLTRLGIPSVELTANHRLTGAGGALHDNVTGFKSLRCGKDLAMDDSFRLTRMEGGALPEHIVEEAARRYLADESFQVLTTYNSSTALSACALNPLIRDRVNPITPDKEVIACHGKTFYDGDRVMIVKNDSALGCYNGDVGILHIQEVYTEKKLRTQGKGKPAKWVEVTVYSFSVTLPDGRRSFWYEVEASVAMKYLMLAYVVTVHKSQGSQYDTILMPMTMQMQNMLNRNLFYTAISRAKKQVLLYGSAQAVDVAVQRLLPPRKSMLVSKVQMQMLKAA